MAEGRKKGLSFHDLPGNPTTPYRPPEEEPVDDLQHYMDATARQRDRAEKAERALAQERERVRELETRLERFELGDLERTSKAHADSYHADMATEDALNAMERAEKVEADLACVVEGMGKIASYNADELRSWDEDNAADMVEIARQTLDRIQHNPAALEGER